MLDNGASTGVVTLATSSILSLSMSGIASHHNLDEQNLNPCESPLEYNIVRTWQLRGINVFSNIVEHMFKGIYFIFAQLSLSSHRWLSGLIAG